MYLTCQTLNQIPQMDECIMEGTLFVSVLNPAVYQLQDSSQAMEYPTIAYKLGKYKKRKWLAFGFFLLCFNYLTAAMLSTSFSWTNQPHNLLFVSLVLIQPVPYAKLLSYSDINTLTSVVKMLREHLQRMIFFWHGTPLRQLPDIEWK